MRIADESLAAHPEQNVQQWAEGVYEQFETYHVELISFVPDGRHKNLIAYSSHCRTVSLSSLTRRMAGQCENGMDAC